MVKRKIESDYDISWRLPFKKKRYTERFYSKSGANNFVKRIKKAGAIDIKVKGKKY